MTDDIYKVYRIRFDKEVYVGLTKQDINKRMEGHKSNPSNRRVHELLHSGADYEVDIVAGRLTHERGIKRETKEIDILRKSGYWKVLNVFTPGKEAGELSKLRAKERKLGKEWKVCALCRRRLPLTKYHVAMNKARLSSRCRDCRNFHNWALQYCSRTGTETGTELSNREVRKWASGGYKDVHPHYRRPAVVVTYKYNRLDPDKKDIIPAYMKRKISATQLAKRYGVSLRVVYRWLEKNGVPCRKRLSQWQIDKLIDLYTKENLLTSEIAAKMNISIKTVQGRLAKAKKVVRKKLEARQVRERQVDNIDALAWERKEEIRTIVRTLNFNPPQGQRQRLLDKLRMIDPANPLLVG